MPVTVDDLRRLDPDAFAAVLALRPDVMGPTEPRSVQEVGARLNHPASLELAVRSLDVPTLQVARALVQLGCPTDATTLPRFLRLGTVEELEALERCLGVLDLLLLREDCGCIADGLAERWNPYGLGPNLLRALGWRTNEWLREALAQWGEPTGGPKVDLVDRLAAVLVDGPRLRENLADAPEADRRLLEQAALGDGTIELGWDTRRRGRQGPGAWLVARGFTDGALPGPAQLPAEVTIALRGDAWRPDFDWRPPVVATTPLSREQVDREAAAAAGRTLRLLTDLVREAMRAPLRLNRDGTLGKRERGRLAALLRAEPAHVTWAVSLAFAAGLLAHLEETLAPTEGSTTWTGLPPARRHAELVDTWLDTPQEVLADPDLGWSPVSHLRFSGSRHVALRVLADLPDQAPVSRAEVSRLCAWSAPVPLGEEDGEALVAGAMTEATLLGLVGADALSSLGHVVVAGDGDVDPVLDRWLGAPSGTARLQADLTAVVLGEPSPRLTRVLDLVAVRETSDQATTWRFDARSLARAMDAGHDADGLLAALASVAEGEVPQPLEYLVTDTARRHGVLRAAAAACVLRSDDHALLAEVAADSRLRSLGLRLMGRGVLVGDAPLGSTLDRVRAAGYLPLHEDATGSPVTPDTGPVLAQVSDYVSRTSPRLRPEEEIDSLQDEAARVLALPDRAPAPLLEIRGGVIDSRSLPELFEQELP